MASTHPLVERFRAGDVPAPMKAAAARGSLPLAAEDLLEILFLLRRETSRELQQDIIKTIEGLPDDVLRHVADAPGTPPPMLDFLARAGIRRDAVLERVVRNPSTADATLALLAQHGSESILEFLSFNQIRLTRAPQILQVMLQNARCTQSIRRRLQEIWELHRNELSQKARVTTDAPAAQPSPSPAAGSPAARPPDALPPVAAAASPAAAAGATPAPGALAAEEALGETMPAEPSAAEVAQAAVLAAEAEALTAEADAASLEDLAALDEYNAKILEEMSKDDDVTEEDLRLAQRLLTMTVPEKIQLALKGGRNDRMILIRDASKLVQESVVNSPKITDNEIEQISKMRSIGVDIIRALLNRREAMKIYTVVSNLVKNPKTPLPDAMTLMQRLQDRDLNFLVKDKNVPDAVRRQAGIVIEKRKPKGPKKAGH